MQPFIPCMINNYKNPKCMITLTYARYFPKKLLVIFLPPQAAWTLHYLLKPQHPLLLYFISILIYLQSMTYWGKSLQHYLVCLDQWRSQVMWLAAHGAQFSSRVCCCGGLGLLRDMAKKKKERWIAACTGALMLRKSWEIYGDIDQDHLACSEACKALHHIFSQTLGYSGNFIRIYSQW